MNEPGNTDAQDVEHNHRSGIDGHVHDVGRRRQNSGNDKEGQHRATNVLEQELRVHHTHQRGKTDHNWQLKSDGQSKDHGEKYFGVLVNRDLCVESLAVRANKKVHCYGKNITISKVPACNEQSNRQEKERQDKPLLTTIETRRNKLPNLIQDNRTSDKNTGHQSDFQIHVEGREWIQIGEPMIDVIFLEYHQDWLFHQRINLVFRKPPTNARTRSHRRN